MLRVGAAQVVDERSVGDVASKTKPRMSRFFHSSSFLATSQHHFAHDFYRHTYMCLECHGTREQSQLEHCAANHTSTSSMDA